MTRVLRCSACARRIRAHHPHIGLLNLQTGEELASYHARCQERAARDFAAMVERGKAYILRHYHGAACPDEAPGFGCAGGCFSRSPAAVAN
jgi:hypothetical protein